FVKSKKPSFLGWLLHQIAVAETKVKEGIDPFIKELFNRKKWNVSIVALNSLYKSARERALDAGISPDEVRDVFDALDPSLEYDELAHEVESMLGIALFPSRAELESFEQEAKRLGYVPVKKREYQEMLKKTMERRLGVKYSDYHRKLEEILRKAGYGT
ncbi:MAG: hypothetical protein ACP5IT_10370, partial [Thermoproteota archaeon]